jgi:glycosyltransferase involved in cell wall biosynthesis
MSDAPVSVIIPCLNAEWTLAEAIDSALQQTVPPCEILVIDDGSSDRSVEVARGFGWPVRVLGNPGRGPGAARRFGVSEAAGDFIAYVDADDILEPVKHERQLEVFEKADPHTLVHTGSTIFRDGQDTMETTRAGAETAAGRCTQVIFERNPVCGASTMIRRDVVLTLGNYDPDLVGTEDFGMSLVASTRCDFVYLPEPLYRIRRHDGNITNRSSHMAYVHWLAQERFRQKCPDAYNALSPASIREFMIDPVVRAAKEAYYRRDPKDYARLIRLAHRLAPDDPEIRAM